MISFIIPAHNEEQYLGAALDALLAAAREVGEPFEVIVVDDDSADATAAVARQRGVRVIPARRRQIAAARNAGAREASGEFLFFVDADTLANTAAIRAGLTALRSGAVGGGCVFRFDGVLPLWARVLYPLAAFLARRIKTVGGCFLFCTRQAFDAAGGFCERYYAAEETAFIQALKQQGRFVIPRPTVVTSGRKLRGYSARTILRIIWRFAFRGPAAFQSREGLEIWYGDRPHHV
jgi:glycosyltransferase involved in cell wall biosynthesis